jgi:hypothetical protein
VAQDTDEDLDIYDARIHGGFREPTSAPSCEGEECQGALTGPLAALDNESSGGSGVGNLPSPGVRLPGEASAPTAKAQRLAESLKTCHRYRKPAKRKTCEAATRRKYGPTKKAAGKKRKRAKKR